MRQPLHSIRRAIASLAFVGAGPRTSVLILGCGLTGTAYGLGMSWLARPIVGLPVALWLVAGAMLGTYAALTPMWQSRVQHRNARRRRGALSASMFELAGVPARHVEHTKRNIENLVRRVRVSENRITIGVDMGESAAMALMDAGRVGAIEPIGGVAADWRRTEPGLIANGPEDARRFDALVRAAGMANMTVFTREDAEREAAWFDWSCQLPLGYPGVFPARIDAGKVTAGFIRMEEPVEVRLLATLAQAAAVLACSPARVGGPASLAGLRSGRFSLADGSRATASAMTRLAEALGAITPEERGRPEAACRSAARALTAYLATTHADFNTLERLHIVESAATFIADEPEAHLRLGAVQIAAGQVESAKASFVRAIRLIRGTEAVCHHDPLVFVLAEAAHAGMDRLTIGRVCAGVALACASAANDRFEYLHEDLRDDLRHAGWGFGREEDMALVQDVVRSLEEALEPARVRRIAA